MEIEVGKSYLFKNILGISTYEKFHNTIVTIHLISGRLCYFDNNYGAHAYREELFPLPFKTICKEILDGKDL